MSKWVKLATAACTVTTYSQMGSRGLPWDDGELVQLEAQLESGEVFDLLGG